MKRLSRWFFNVLAFCLMTLVTAAVSWFLFPAMAESVGAVSFRSHLVFWAIANLCGLIPLVLPRVGEKKYDSV